MANVNSSLDDIIARRIGGRRSGGVRNIGGSRRIGASGGRKPLARDIDSGKWKHDKFADLYSGKRRGGVGTSTRIGSGGGGKDIVKVNISNLPDTVVTADLAELFQDFTVYGVSVHYDELGQHLGTADLFVNNRSAKDILREYARIAIDGQELKFAIVDESGRMTGGRAPIQDRIRRVTRNPIRKEQRRSSGAGGGVGGRRTRSTDRRRSGGPIKSGGGGAGGRGKGNSDKKVMSVDELDKQLEAYMGSRHPAIQQP